MKPGIVVIAEIDGAAGQRIHEIQRRYDPRMAAELPPHLTLTGSSGMGPIAVRTTEEELRAALEPIAVSTPPITLQLAPPIRFMQTSIVVLPADPHGPLRALHERIKTSGLEYESPRFAFTPHVTLNFYPELSRERARELLAVRIDEPIVINRVQVYRTITLTKTSRILELELTGS